MSQDHPTERELLSYVSGQTSGTISAAIETHLENCRVCSKRLAELTHQDDSFITALRDSGKSDTLKRQQAESLQAAASGDTATERRPDSAQNETESLDESVMQSTVHLGSRPSASLRSRTPQQLPEKFDRYHIVRKLGQGAMGAVYLANDSQLDRLVAIKVPFFDADDGPDVINRFYREAQAMATLHHPNVCQVFDAGEKDGVHYLTMAYIDGRPLADYLQKENRQSSRQVAIVARKLAIALQSAHDAGIVHRDLKPANIMITKGQEPVITDFGLSVDERKARLTQTGEILGTPAYMAPEQLDGNPETIGPPTDVYALGVIMYQMMSGQLPFQGSLTSIIVKILKEQPRAPRAVHANVAPALEAICLKAMAKQIDDRYRSARDLAKDLGKFLRGERPTAFARTTSSTDSDYEFTIRCPLCRTSVDVTSAQIGVSVTCPDCHSHIPVEEPGATQRSDRTSSSRSLDELEVQLGSLESQQQESLRLQPVTPPRPAKPQSQVESRAQAALRVAEEEIARKELEEAEAELPIEKWLELVERTRNAVSSWFHRLRGNRHKDE